MAVVRVLPDDRFFDEVPDEALTYDYIYKHVLEYYERVYPFMSHFVFSFRDKGSVMEFAPLIKAVCAQENVDKTFYMPPTRELSMSRRNLLVRYCEKVIAENLPKDSFDVRGPKAGDKLLPLPSSHDISSREELIVALQVSIFLIYFVL